MWASRPQGGLLRVGLGAGLLHDRPHDRVLVDLDGLLLPGRDPLGEVGRRQLPGLEPVEHPQPLLRLVVVRVDPPGRRVELGGVVEPLHLDGPDRLGEELVEVELHLGGRQGQRPVGLEHRRGVLVRGVPPLGEHHVQEEVVRLARRQLLAEVQRDRLADDLAADRRGDGAGGASCGTGIWRGRGAGDALAAPVLSTGTNTAWIREGRAYIAPVKGSITSKPTP